MERKFICLHYSLTRLSFARIRWWSHMCLCIGMEAPLDLGSNCLKSHVSGGIFSSRAAGWFSGKGNEGGTMMWIRFRDDKPLLGGEAGSPAFEVPSLHHFHLILHLTHFAGTVLWAASTVNCQKGKSSQKELILHLGFPRGSQSDAEQRQIPHQIPANVG